MKPLPLASILSAAMLATSCASPAGDSTELQPQDFASGARLSPAPADQPFFKVDVPGFVFSQTAWPDLRDLRVFNAAGESVPFARVGPVAGGGKRERVGLRSFRLESAQPGGAPRIEVDARERGVELRVAPGATPETGVEYLFEVPDPNLKSWIDKLIVDWEPQSANWQQKVMVSVSGDLDHWRTVAAARPLMDLRTDDGQRLKHDEIVVERSAPQSARYWRLRFAPGFAPRLTSVEAEATTAAPPPPGVPLAASAQQEGTGAAIYSLTARQPVARLRIVPQQVNSVLPLLIEGREADADKWQPLGLTVAYRLNDPNGEQSSEPVEIHGRILKSIRLRSTGIPWGLVIPTVQFERDPLTLVVNARGSGPFLLAWGSMAAADSAVPFDVLVPRQASGTSTDMTVVEAQTMLALGGPSRLTAPSRAERAARWQTTLVWVVLIGGAGALAVLAFRVWQESRGDRKL